MLNLNQIVWWMEFNLFDGYTSNFKNGKHWIKIKFECEFKMCRFETDVPKFDFEFVFN